MKVSCLITTPPNCDPNLCSLTLDTIKVGFPSVIPRVTLNGIVHDSVMRKTLNCDNYNGCCTHYEWIRQELTRNSYSNEPLILLDGDVIFFESVENFQADPSFMIAGHYVPSHINAFSKCLYLSRLHTSFLWIYSPKKLWEAITSIYADRSPKERDYLLVDLISPRVSFIDSKALFHDTCSGLFQAFGGEHFNAEMLDKFFHINSASFYPEVMNLLLPAEQEQYAHIHHLARQSSKWNQLRGGWKATNDFYRSWSMSLHEYLYQ